MQPEVQIETREQRAEQRQQRIKSFIERSLQIAKQSRSILEKSLQERDDKRNNSTFQGWLKRTFLGESQQAYDRDLILLRKLNKKIELLENELSRFPRISLEFVTMVKSDLIKLVNNSVPRDAEGHPTMDWSITKEEASDWNWSLAQSLVFLETLDPYKYAELREAVDTALKEELRLVEFWPSSFNTED